MRRKIAAGNWKLNGNLVFADGLLGALDVPQGGGVEVLVFPPVPYIAGLASRFGGRGIGFGAQDVSEHAKGAFTGEVAGPMLKEVGAGHVLVGHSERRQYHGETSEIVARKFVAAKAAGLVPVLCIGETLDEREAGLTEVRLAEQLDAVFDVAGPQALDGAVVAYEPVWAIGTGKNATSVEAEEVHEFIRSILSEVYGSPALDVRILYGGSVTADNFGELIAMKNINGALVGGASLKSENFLGIISRALENNR